MVPPEEEHAVSPPPHPPVDVQPAADLPEAPPQETQADPSLGLVETKEAAEPPPEPPELPEAPQPPQPPQSPPAADPVPAEVAEPLSPSAGAAAPSLQLPATHFDLLPPPPPPGGNSPGDYVLPPAFPSPGGEQGQLTEQQQQWQQHWQAMGPQGGEIAPTEQWGAMDYYVDANGYAAEPEFDHNAARQKITQYRKEAAARRRRQMRIAEKKSVAMRAELDKESEVRAFPTRTPDPDPNSNPDPGPEPKPDPNPEPSTNPNPSPNPSPSPNPNQVMARRQAERETELKAKRDERYQKQADDY